MSDTSAIRNALNGHIDKQNQGDSATLRSTLTDSFYNSLDQVYALPYADSTPSVPTKVQTTTPAPTQPTQPAITYKPNTAPAQPQTQAGGNWFSNIVDQFTANMKQGTDTLHDIPNLPDVIEPVGGAVWAGANTVLGLAGNVADTVTGGLNALDERMAADENAGQLPTNYKPFTEQVADIAGQYNERVANPIAGIGAKTLGSLASNLPNYTKENPSQNLLTAPTPDTQQTMDRAWKDLLSGNVIGAVDNGLRSFGDYGNEQFAQLDPKAALLASLIFDPLNFLPGAGIGEAQKAGKLGELTKGVARIEEAADLLPKGIMGRIGTPVAKVTEALNTGLKSLWHNTADLTNADEYFGTMRAFETAGKDTKSFEQVLKTYARLDTVPAQRIEKFMQGMTPHIDEVETAFRTVERGLQTGEDMGKLPKNFARFVEDVKAGKASSSDLFEFTKGEMISRLQDEMAKNSAKLYPLKNASAPANIANRFLNNLKGFEALVYIGLSPITFVRNIVNGLTTMAIEGVNPFFSATGEIARLRKLGQVERAADLQRAMKFHETLLNTGGLVRQAYGQGQFATGATGPLGSFMSKMIHGSPLGKPLQWYQQIENGMRQKVWTGTYYNAIRHNVDRIITPIDAATEAVLHQYRVPTSDVTNVIKEGLLTGKQPGAIMRDLNDLMDGKRAPSIDWNAVADEMGVPREHLNALLDEHDQAKAYAWAREVSERVFAGEPQPQVVEDVIARGAQEATQATAERIGIDLGGDLESQRGELISRWNDASKLKGAKARAEADALFEQIGQIEDEMKARSAKPPPDVPPEAPAAPVAEPKPPPQPSGGIPQGAIPPIRENSLQYVVTLDGDNVIKTPRDGFGFSPKKDKRIFDQLGDLAPRTEYDEANNRLIQEAVKGRHATAEEVSRVANLVDEKGLSATGILPSDVIVTPDGQFKIVDVGNFQPHMGGAKSARVTPLDENPLPPVDLPTAQLSPSQEKARAYLLTLTKADGSPLYTAEQLATWKPDSIDRIAGELQTARVTMDDVLKVAKGKGISTATDTGRPNNRHLLNVLNKHKAEGAAQFRNIDDVKARADEARKILEGYAPEAKAATKPVAVAPKVTEIPQSAVQKSTAERTAAVESAAKQSRSDYPPALSQSVADAATEYKFQLKEGEAGKRIAMYDTEAVGEGGNTWTRMAVGTTNAPFYRKLSEKYGTSKPAVNAALEKIIADKGKDKGITVERLKELILRDLANGLETTAGKMPRDPEAMRLLGYPQDMLDEAQKLWDEAMGGSHTIGNVSDASLRGAEEAATTGDAARYEEIQNEISDILKQAKTTKDPYQNGILHDRLVALEREAKIHEPAALKKAQSEIDALKARKAAYVEPVPEPTNRLTASPFKLAGDYKARGMDRYQAWDQFIIDRNLKPDIDAKEFYQVYDGVDAKRITNVSDRSLRGIDPDEMHTSAPAKQARNASERLSVKVGNYDVEVIKNPTSQDYIEMNKRYRRENLGEQYRDDPRTRYTIDEQGNRYIWKSTDALHAQIEPQLSQQIGSRVAQDMPEFGIHTSAPPKQRFNAADAIDELRRVATEDEQATKILSRDEMVKAKARTQADMLEALYNLWNREDVRRLRLGSDAKNRVMAYGRREVVKAANDLRMAATVAADHMDNAVMISRDGETRFDAALSVLAPFQFWRSRFALQSLRRVADKPARLAWYLKLRDMQDSVHDDPRFPKRLRGMLELPWLGVPQWAGGSMFFDPLEFGTNVESVFGLNQFANTVDDSDVAQSIRALAGRGAVNADEAANAIANRKGALWEQTKQRLEQLSQSTEGLSAFSDMFRPHMPLDILWKLKTGNAADIGVLFPMSRIIRAATGVNPEGFIKQGLRNLTGNQEIPDWDAWEQYRTDRALADMVGNGELNERDALLALIERKGQYYEKAQQRAQEQMQMQTFSVFGGQLFPQGEREYYKARVTRDQLIDQAVAQLGGNPADMSYGEKTTLIKANGLDKKGTPLGDFYTTYPVYGSRQDVYAEPEGRMKGFLTDEMWTRYNSLSALDKRKVKNENKDLASFINNPERDYAAVTIDQMGTFVKTLRGYLPASDLTPKIGNVNQISYATPDQSARYQNILDTQKQYFNLDAMQPKLDTYSNLSANDKRAYRVANPEVDAYFKWYGEQMRANPDVSKILNPDYQQSAGNFYNTQAATNSVMRQVSSNVNYMVRRIGDDTARRYHAQGGATVKGKPMVLSAKVRAALMARRKNPGYFIPRDVYAELLSLFRKDNNGIPDFNRWLAALVAGGV